MSEDSFNAKFIKTMTEFVARDNDILTHPRQKDIATRNVATDSLCVVQGGGTNVK